MVKCDTLDQINWLHVSKLTIVNSVKQVIYKGYYEDPACPSNDGPILVAEDRLTIKSR
jgi:hypothetical protein